MRTRSCASASKTIRSKTRLTDVVPRDRHAAGGCTLRGGPVTAWAWDRSRGKEQEQQRRRAEMEAGRTEHGPRHEQMRGARCLFLGYLLDEVASAIQFPASQSLHQTVRPVLPLITRILCPHFLSRRVAIVPARQRCCSRSCPPRCAWPAADAGALRAWTPAQATTMHPLPLALSPHPCSQACSGRRAPTTSTPAFDT